MASDLHLMRILLDSNIWRYLTDAGEVERLVSVVGRSKCTLCIAPASLFEAAHCAQPELRASLLSAMVDPPWRRLMPEAFHETMEICSEVHRCRPEWKRSRPDLRKWQALKHDWIRRRRGAWDRIRRDPTTAKEMQEEDLELGRAQARELRRHAQSMPPSLARSPLNSFLVHEKGNELEEPAEAWRMGGLVFFSAAMSEYGHTYADWLEGQVNIAAMLSDKAELRQFWLREVKAAHMPRHWLRWAFEFLQSLHKVTDGTPGDCQLGTYLLDVDLFISADRVLVEIAERCRREAPFQLAQTIRVPGGSLAVEGTFEAVRAAR